MTQITVPCVCTLVGICENDSLLLEFIVDEKGDYIGLYFDGIPYYYVRNVQGDVVAISDQCEKSGDGSMIEP